MLHKGFIFVDLNLLHLVLCLDLTYLYNNQGFLEFLLLVHSGKKDFGEEEKAASVVLIDGT